MSRQPTTHVLEVPDGTLHFELRGSGPLLLVVGQPMTSGPFGPLADRLATDHTVLTYDPHGLGRSTATASDDPITPEIEADDLAALIDAAGGGPAEVFGTSGGAVAALALAVRHPAAVRTVLAHEPPVAELLPDAEHVRAAVDGVEAAYRAHGSGGAWGGFVALVMHQGEVTAAGPDPAPFPPPAADPPPADAAPEPAGPPAPSAKQLADDRTFFLRMLKPFTRYRPDVAALRAAPARIVVAVGADSGPEVARRSAEALAEQLGMRPVRFPGHHGGFMDDPDGFAAAIRAALAAG